MMDFTESLYALYPQVVRTVGEEAFDVDGKPVAYDRAAVEAAVAATAYQRNRQPEYPPITDLADALYWASEGDSTKLDEYYAACAAVKAKYPKEAS